MSITRSQIARQMYANGGRGYSDYASPSSTTASQDFATQATSGGTDWEVIMKYNITQQFNLIE